jgi:hypothetical protein
MSKSRRKQGTDTSAKNLEETLMWALWRAIRR